MPRSRKAGTGHEGVAQTVPVPAQTLPRLEPHSEESRRLPHRNTTHRNPQENTMSRHLATELTNHTVVVEHVEEILTRLQGEPGYGWGKHRGHVQEKR